MGTAGISEHVDHRHEISTYLGNLHAALDAVSMPDLVRVVAAIEQVHREGGVVYVCGNGGSAATASHLVTDLAKGARRPGLPPIRAISLADQVPSVTAWANDFGYDSIFSGQLEGLARPGDLLLVISASGNSPNILEGLRCARKLGMGTVGLLGPSGGQAAELCDHWVAAPARHIEEQEDLHLSMAHMLARCLRNAFDAQSGCVLAGGTESPQ